MYNLYMEDKVIYIKNWLGSGSINIFGIQFSGKDTVGKRLADAVGAEFLSSGDIVRSARDNSKDSSIKRAAQVSESGALTPMEEFIKLIVPYMYDEKIAGKALVLSSVGRWIGEEGPVLEGLRKGSHDTKAVLLLNVSEDEVWHRWHEAQGDTRNVGRTDDIDKEKVARRISEFKDKTLPVIEVYRGMGILLEIDGQQDRDSVFSDVIDRLYAFATTEKP